MAENQDEKGKPIPEDKGKETEPKKDGEAPEKKDGEEEGKETEIDKVKTVPIWAMKKLESKLKKELSEQYEGQIKELKKANEDLAGKIATGELSSSEDIQKFADKHSLDKGFVAELMALVMAKSKLPDEDAEAIKEFKASKDRQYQMTKFEEDFIKNVTPILGEVDEKRKAEIKEKLRSLAFTEEYKKVPLQVIYLGNPSEFAVKEKKKTAEGAQTKIDNTITDFEGVTPEDIRKMSSETYRKYQEWKLSKFNNTQGRKRVTH